MKWVSTFKYLRINYGEKIANISDTTQRVTFTNNIDGNRVRIRFSNKYDDSPMTIEKAIIGKVKEDGLEDTAIITLGGKDRIELEPDTEAFSDEIAFDVSAGDKLFVSLYYKEKKDINSFCCYWSPDGAKVDFSGEGEGFVITSEFLNQDPNLNIMSYFIGFDAVQVYTADETKVIAAFGDSITHMSFYTDELYKRICAECKGKVSLINSGIGGNRLVDDPAFIPDTDKRLVLFGEAGVKRFEKDVFELDEVDSVCCLIGINDIMHPLQLENRTDTITAKELINGYKKIISCAHNNGAEIYLGTIMPSWHDDYPAEWLSVFETARNEVNAWIRKGELHDGVIDFDMALKNEDNNSKLKDGCHIGDGLHPNTKGGELMAGTVDLKTIVCARER